MKKNGLLFTICGIAILAGVFVRSFSLVNAILAIVGVIIYEVGVMIRIKNKHGTNTPLSIFPAMSVSCSIEMGRARMPKADMPWIIYDQNSKEKKFINKWFAVIVICVERVY